MTIADVRVRHLFLPLARGYRSSLSYRAGRPEGDPSDRDALDVLLVEIEDEDGRIGYGESAPMARWPRGLNPAAIQAIVELEHRPLLLGRDPRPVGALVERLERAVVDVPFALAAVDMALWDLLGKGLDRPIYDLMGGRVRESMALHCSIGIDALDHVEGIAEKATKRGFADFKLKVGGPDFDRELEAVRTLREAAGGHARIRVDANQAWSADEALRRVRELASLGVVLVEQPVPYWDLAGMARVRRATSVPIMADESCFTARDVMQVVRFEAADVINVKLMKCGGLWNARKLAAVAEAAGLTCFMGSMLETELGAAAAFHFALSHDIVRHPTGALNSLTEKPLAVPPWTVREARAHPAGDVAGLGIHPDPRILARYARGPRSTSESGRVRETPVR